MSGSGFFYIVCAALLFSGCNKEGSSESQRSALNGTVQLSFRHAVDNETLQFGEEYHNAWGEAYTVSRFRFYVHNIRLVDTNGVQSMLSADYFLVDEDNAASKTIKLEAPVGKYKSLIYILGVDSARNMSGAQTGSLDPGKGMFWTWNTGYVMAKLEGHSNASTGLNHEFSYHVGGYKSPYIVIREITLPVDDAGEMKVVHGESSTITIKANINTWFSYNTQVRIADDPACHSPGELAMRLANNYEGMFSIESVE